MSMMKRRMMLMPSDTIISVLWNQLCYSIDADNWRAYNTSNASVSFADGVATLTWLKSGQGYAYSIRPKVSDVQVTLGDVMYLSYEINPSVTANYSTEFAGGVVPSSSISCPSDTWTRIAFMENAGRTGSGLPYLMTKRGGSAAIGNVCRCRNPIYINLTAMFGAGNEPATISEFETQCLKNNVDLCSFHARDATGTTINWKI